MGGKKTLRTEKERERRKTPPLHDDAKKEKREARSYGPAAGFSETYKNSRSTTPHVVQAQIRKKEGLLLVAVVICNRETRPDSGARRGGGVSNSGNIAERRRGWCEQNMQASAYFTAVTITRSNVRRIALLSVLSDADLPISFFSCLLVPRACGEGSRHVNM